MSASGKKMLAFAKIHGSSMITALNGSGMFFAVMLAQASVESAYGNSKPAKQKKNFFGIMSNRRVATFDSEVECFRYYTQLFGRLSNYVQKNVIGQTDPFKQLRAIADAGYYSCNNDDPKSLPASLRAKFGHISAKESADHYYNTIKPFISEILLNLPIGKINNAQDIASANTQILTTNTNV